MARATNSFGRRAPRFKPQPTVLVLCEDAKSGRQYLDDATKHFRIHVDVEVSHCGKTDPKGIVGEGIGALRSYDRVFCVIDRDTHPGFDEALLIAKEHARLSVVPSYPCLEFWYRLHFGFTRAPYSAAGKKSAGDCVVAELRKCEGMQDYAKGGEVGVFELLLPRLDGARRTSLRVLEQAVAESALNPSSRLHELFDFFERLASPQLV